MYKEYENARNTAWQTLIKCNISELPVRLGMIVDHFNAKIKNNSDVNILRDNQLGCIAILDSEKYIILDRTVSIQRQRYTLAHELGHIALKHTLQNIKLNRDSVIIYTDPQEYEAERFATDILAPACILWGLNLHSAEEIAEICNISIRSAEIRARRMETLYQRNKFLTHPLEQKLYTQFYDFVKNNRK